LRFLFSFKTGTMQAKTGLNTDNPEHITWSHEQITVVALGGVKIDGLDRLRVTLKIEYKQQAIRHNLDLYNDTALDKLVKRCAERFTLGTAYVSGLFAAFINELEAYRLKQLTKQARVNTPVVVAGARKEEVIQFLQAPDLLKRTNDLIGQSGVIGEENNRLLMYLVFTSRKREQPLHVISLGSSGTGKSHLQEKVGELVPSEDRIEITALTENAFYYFGKQELKHKLILIEDLDGAGDVLYPLRELQSKKVINKTVAIKTANGDTQTTTLRVEGPVCVAGCTTKEAIYEDNANRSFLLYLDESREQDSRIMEYQRLKSAGKVDVPQEGRIKAFLQDVQRVIEPITVVNPYAEYLQLPAGVYKPRRTNAHYLQFIEAITFYHQFQREQKVNKETGEMYIETTLQDIEEANRLMKDILLRKSDELTGASRNYFEALKQYLKKSDQDSFTNRQISKVLYMPLSTVKRHNLHLQQAGCLMKQVNENEKRQFTYRLTDEEDYSELQTGIYTALDTILQHLKDKHQPTGSQPAHQSTEPMKRRPRANNSSSALAHPKDIPHY
jgi:DNA-binding MarR family transcriptional regulator